MSFPTSPGSRRCICPVPSRHALAFAGSQTARHSRCYQFRGLLIHHCYDLPSCLPPFQETFTSELSTAWSPSPLSDITTVATEQFHRRDFHPQDQQLASLHWLPRFTHLLRPAKLLAPLYGSDRLPGRRGLLLPGFQRVGRPSRCWL